MSSSKDENMKKEQWRIDEALKPKPTNSPCLVNRKSVDKKLVWKSPNVEAFNQPISGTTVVAKQVMKTYGNESKNGNLGRKTFCPEPLPSCQSEANKTKSNTISGIKAVALKTDNNSIGNTFKLNCPATNQTEVKIKDVKSVPSGGNCVVQVKVKAEMLKASIGSSSSASTNPSNVNPKDVKVVKLFPSKSHSTDFRSISQQAQKSHLYKMPSLEYTPEKRGIKPEWRDRSDIKPKPEPIFKQNPEYDRKLSELNQQLLASQKLKVSVNLKSLPDKGAKIISQIAELEGAISQLKLGTEIPVLDTGTVQNAEPAVTPVDQILKKREDKGVDNSKAQISVKMTSSVQKTKLENTQQLDTNCLSVHTSSQPLRQTKMIDFVNPFKQRMAYDHHYSAYPQQQQLYGGRMNKAQLNVVKSVTQEAVEKLHLSLQSCPSVTSEESDPALLQTSLMVHQRQALAWLLWREKQDPAGGILADDMGLGKTLTMVSLILKSRELNSNAENESIERLIKEGVIPSKGTLVVCPASLLHQWAQEIETHCQPFTLSVLIYHGGSREKNWKKIANHDVVITTYSIVSREVGKISEEASSDSPIVQRKVCPQDSVLLKIAWTRVILDEAHNIKNPKSVSNQSVCQLRAKHRWALSGTPIHNKLMDMYALLRFLRCSPFDELKVWKKWVDNSSAQGTARLNTLVKSLMLRRTKDQKSLQGVALLCLPPKQMSTHKLKLSGKEKTIYDKLMSYSRLAVEEMLKKQMEKREMGATATSNVPGTTVSNTLLLVLLLRLQQCCGHLSLLKKAFKRESSKDDEVEEDDKLIQQMGNLSLTKDKEQTTSAQTDVLSILSEYKNDLEFEDSCPSTKIAALLSHLESIRSASKNEKSAEKCVIVSQWTSMLRVIGFHLKKQGYRYHLIQGDVKPEDRMKAVDDFNRNSSGAEVMMLSLKAGGVGLNLVGGNHLFVVDLHWNPALESQACDRIYRVGQRKDVFIHRFVCEETIEERILYIQEKKASLAKGVLEGGAQVNKLTWNDLKLLFDLR